MGVTRGREEATEGEGKSTWEDERDGGVEPGRGKEYVVGAGVGAMRHSRELTELQREVFYFD